MPVKGEFMTADGGRAVDPRRAAIKKNMFLTSDAPAHRGGFAAVPADLEPVALGVAELVRRLGAVRRALDADTKARRK